MDSAVCSRHRLPTDAICLVIIRADCYMYMYVRREYMAEDT